MIEKKQVLGPLYRYSYNAADTAPEETYILAVTHYLRRVKELRAAVMRRRSNFRCRSKVAPEYNTPPICRSFGFITTGFIDRGIPTAGTRIHPYSLAPYRTHRGDVLSSRS